MKICFVCNKSYSYLCPIYSKQYDFYDTTGEKFDPPRVTKKGNYCSTECLRQYSSTLTKYFPEESVYLAYIPIGLLEMCQFCGYFSHPSEFCCAPDTQFQSFQTIGNTTGEWSECRGKIVYAITGRKCDLKVTKVYFSACMQKLRNDEIKDRYPLVYFWWSEESCTEICSRLEIPNQETVELGKEIILKVEPKLSEREHLTYSTTILHESNKVICPNKIFFPYDIRNENCWWPLDQSHTFIEEEFHDSPLQIQSSRVIDYDATSVFKYDDDDFNPEIQPRPLQEMMPNVETDDEEEKDSQ